MSEHTKGPYRATLNHVLAGDVAIAECLTHRKTNEQTRECYLARMEDEANAAHIARCLKAHDALVEALEQALSESSYDSDEGPASWIGDARAALALARGVNTGEDAS